MVYCAVKLKRKRNKLSVIIFQNTTGVSDYAITFGNVEIKRQLGLEFYVYHLGAAGIQMTREDLNI